MKIIPSVDFNSLDFMIGEVTGDRKSELVRFNPNGENIRYILEKDIAAWTIRALMHCYYGDLSAAAARRLWANILKKMRFRAICGSCGAVSFVGLRKRKVAASYFAPFSPERLSVCFDRNACEQCLPKPADSVIQRLVPKAWRAFLDL
jgi:hypothetical protein